MTELNIDQSTLHPATTIAGCGDVTCELLVNPIPRPKPASFQVKIQPTKRRVVFLDNNKPNSMDILRAAQNELRRRGIDVEEEILVKPNAGIDMPADLMGQLSQERGLLIMGIND